MRTAAVLAALFAAGVFAAGVTSEPEAVVLVRRTFLNDSFVEGVPMHVSVQVWNVGSADASNVTVTDATPAQFNATPAVHVIPTLSPGATVIKNYTFTPLSAGPFVVRPVAYAYGKSEGHTGEGELDAYAETQRAFYRRTSPHLVEWGVFLVMAIIAVGAPFTVWWSQRSSRRRGSKKTN